MAHDLSGCEIELLRFLDPSSMIAYHRTGIGKLADLGLCKFNHRHRFVDITQFGREVLTILQDIHGKKLDEELQGL